MASLLVLLMSAMSLSGAAKEIANVSPTDDLGVVVWTEPGYPLAPGSGGAEYDQETGFRAVDAATGESNAAQEENEVVSKTKVLTPEEYREIIATPEPTGYAVTGTGNMVPKPSDGVADGVTDTSEVSGLVNIKIEPGKVTLSTSSDVVLKIPAGAQLVHYLGATRVIYTFESEEFLANTHPIVLEDVDATNIRYGNVELRQPTGAHTYKTIAAINVPGSLKVAV